MVTEKLVSLYVTTDVTVATSSPEIVDTLPPSEAKTIEGLDRLASMADDLHQQAEMEAWNQVESFAQEARQERERETEIKHQHAERHFEEEINQWEDRLETYQARDDQKKTCRHRLEIRNDSWGRSVAIAMKNSSDLRRRDTLRRKSLNW
ncbi:hypothetical protein [Halorubrum sp. BOL3-1]|uniref:hypothetical protein n=1 Tax=Halorubrum sp. BOL3-1 TaxID=2497325 RepID=UPI001F4F1AE3|nr:hypothetical protein [Halorubrum sp. BOL3-1]